MYTHIHSHQHAPVHTLPCMAPCESSHTYFCAWFLTHLRACGPCACRAGERSRGAPGLAGNGHSGGSPGHAPVSKFLSQPSPILALLSLGEHHGSLVWGPWQRNEQNDQHAHEKLTRQKQLGRSFVCWGWGGGTAWAGWRRPGSCRMGAGVCLCSTGHPRLPHAFQPPKQGRQSGIVPDPWQLRPLHRPCLLGHVWSW